MTQEHPLQPFSARYFHEGDDLFSYASEWQVLHQASEPETQTASSSMPTFRKSR